MVNSQQLGEVLRLLTHEGFTPKRARGRRRAFEGAFKLSKGAVTVRLEIVDWDFLEYPSVRLLKRPDFFPLLTPHVSADGDLCYFLPDSVVLDRFNPAASILLCLRQAQDVLEEICVNPIQRAQDIQDEFLAYWILGQSDVWPVVMGTVAVDDEWASYFVLGSEDNRTAMISRTRDEVSRFAHCLGLSQPRGGAVKCWLIRSSLYPAAPLKLPETVHELLDYLKAWDKTVYNRVQQILERCGEYLDYSFVTFAVRTPAGWLGFGFDLHRQMRLGYRRNPNLYKQYLHNKGGSQRIFRLAVIDVSPAFLHSRNLIFPDLRGKHITLIGCGAIGGYLAQALARLGAGSGSGAQLSLIDCGSLESENIGRHCLGMNSLFQPKARALAEQLRQHFPEINVKPVIAEVQTTPSLFAADLVIDATGNEAVSEMLNAYHRSARKAVPPFLYTWIRGNGECVQALWVDSKKFGCYRCLRLPRGSQYRQERFPVLKHEPKVGFVGCHSFTPYAVSAPLQAASLATDMIIDWTKGNPSPRFRTRAIEGADLIRIKNQDVAPIDECPACSTL